MNNLVNYFKRVMEPHTDFEYPDDDEPIPQNVLHDVGIELLIRFKIALSKIAEAPNPRLEAYANLLAFGFDDMLEGKSSASISKEIGVCRTALTKRSCEITRELRIPKAIIKYGKN